MRLPAEPFWLAEMSDIWQLSTKTGQFSHMKRASTLLLALGVSRLSVRKIAFPYCFVSFGTAICRGEHAHLPFGTLLFLRGRETANCYLNNGFTNCITTNSLKSWGSWNVKLLAFLTQNILITISIRKQRVKWISITIHDTVKTELYCYTCHFLVKW